jgi:hypothetical protein
MAVEVPGFIGKRSAFYRHLVMSPDRKSEVQWRHAIELKLSASAGTGIVPIVIERES